jgi:hypothetical protein
MKNALLLMCTGILIAATSPGANMIRYTAPSPSVEDHQRHTRYGSGSLYKLLSDATILRESASLNSFIDLQKSVTLFGNTLRHAASGPISGPSARQWRAPSAHHFAYGSVNGGYGCNSRGPSWLWSTGKNCNFDNTKPAPVPEPSAAGSLLLGLLLLAPASLAFRRLKT